MIIIQKIYEKFLDDPEPEMAESAKITLQRLEKHWK